jgi:hypothetical protein
LTDICADLADGFDLGTLNENIGFLAGMFSKIELTPFKTNDYLFGGFSFFTDAPTLGLFEQMEYANEFAEDNYEEIHEFIKAMVM